jgi:cytochrome c-type biogenesis protein
MVEITLFFLAILGGLVSFLTPCNVVTLPSFITYITSQTNTIKKSILMSLFFSLGFCLMFSIIAILLMVIVGFIGYTFWLKLFSSIVVLCLAIYVFFSKQFTRKAPIYESFQNVNDNDDYNDYNKGNITESNDINQNDEEIDASTIDMYIKRYKGYSGSFILGFSLGSSWIGCITPIYLSIVAIVLPNQDFATGAILFFLYALGIMIPYLIIGATIGKIKQRFFVQLIKVGSKLQKIFAIILLYIGFGLLLETFGISGLLPFF